MSEETLRFGVANVDFSRRGATWRCWTNRGSDQSVYITCRELDGTLHLSLHKTGQWHVSFAGEKFDEMFEEGFRPESRFVGKWVKAQELAPGWIVACRIYTPWYAVSSQNVAKTKKLVWIPAPAEGMMVEVCALISASGVPCDDWPGKTTMNTSLVGSFSLQDESHVWLVARNIPLQEPNIPATISPRFFKGQNADSLSADTLRAVFWGRGEDGSVLFYESPVTVQRVS